MSKKKVVPKKIKKDESAPSATESRFIIRMGLPKMDHLWNDLEFKSRTNHLSKEEELFYKKFGKALSFLRDQPFYPSLNSHEITSLTKKYGKKIFASYLENHTPGAARMFWTYGPNRGEITILALEPHPEPGKYERVHQDPGSKIG